MPSILHVGHLRLKFFKTLICLRHFSVTYLSYLSIVACFLCLLRFKLQLVNIFLFFLNAMNNGFLIVPLGFQGISFFCEVGNRFAQYRFLVLILFPAYCFALN